MTAAPLPFTSVRWKRQDGKEIWVRISGHWGHGAGDVIYYEGSIQDVTGRKNAAQSLLESEERFRRLSQASFEGISITSQGKFIDVNEQFTKMLGYARTELIGQPVIDLVAPESRELVEKQKEEGEQKVVYQELYLYPLLLALLLLVVEFFISEKKGHRLLKTE